MSTRSNITVKIEDEFVNVYCHFDGYPDYLGSKLVEYFNTIEKATKLVEGGDISSISRDGVPDYYAARGETNVDAVRDLVFTDYGNEYNYLFVDGEWYVVDCDDGNTHTLVTDLI